MRHRLTLQGKQELELLLAQFGPMGNTATTLLSGRFGQHPSHQATGQWIAQPPSVSVDQARFTDSGRGHLNQRTALRWEEQGVPKLL
jgi:hypothetical protein